MTWLETKSERMKEEEEEEKGEGLEMKEKWDVIVKVRKTLRKQKSVGMNKMIYINKRCAGTNKRA